MEVDPLQLEPVLETLVALDWIGRVNEIEDEEDTRYMLLADAQSTALEPLIRHLAAAVFGRHRQTEERAALVGVSQGRDLELSSRA